MRRFGLLGLGIWVLGFGIFAFAQEQRGSLGTIGALGQEVKRPPANNAPAPRLPDGTVSLDGLWVGGGPVNDIAQALAHPQTAARNMLISVDDAVTGPLELAGNPMKLSAFADPPTRSRAPDLDADRDRILRELGF